MSTDATQETDTDTTTETTSQVTSRVTGGTTVEAEPVAEAEAASPAPEVDADAGPGDDGGAGTTTAVEQPAVEMGAGRPDRIARLEEEGEVAADYLEELLDIADLDGDIDIDVEDGRAAVSVVAEGDDLVGLQRLAGPRGEVLEALQDLTRLAVQARTGERSRLMLDVAGHRAKRREELQLLAAEAVQQVERDGEPVALDPMNPFERKVVHDAVALAGLSSDSEGEEPHRHVVVSAAG